MEKSTVEKIARRAIAPRSTDPPWRWAEKNIVVDKTSPFPGKFNANIAPWTKEPMECFGDNRVKDLAIMCSAQSGKTQMVITLAAWCIAQDPGPAMWVMAAQDEAKTFARTRLMPTLENCDAVAELFPNDRHAKTTLEINFASMPLVINGANSQSKLQSKPIRWLFLDEVRNYPPGAYEMVIKRTRAFWNARRVVISTPDHENDHVHRAFLAGDQRVYEVLCPECDERHEMNFENIKFDTNEKTYVNDEWDFDELGKTIRYECPHCQAKFLDRQDIRKAFAISGKWRPTNPQAPSEKVSFKWSAVLPPWVSWRDLVQEFLQAKAALKVGTTVPLKIFKAESLGVPWVEEMETDDEIRELPVHDESWPWADEAFRFATVDVQRDLFYLVVRAWALDGQSRLVHWSKPLTFDSIEDLRAQYNVKPHLVFIDSGYNAQKVYAACKQFGFTSLKGAKTKDFAHKIKDETIRRAFSPRVYVDPAVGTKSQGRVRPVTLFHWSNPTCKDVLANLRDAKGASWTVTPDAGNEYELQMFSERRRERHDKAGQTVYEWHRVGKRGNHIWDCEGMQIAAAMMAKCLAENA